MSGSRRHIWVVAGSAGCGKSTVAKHLGAQLNVPYIEGDDFHPPANIAKMSTGTPLNDEDRWDWLTVLREEAVRQLEAGNQGVVMTCSALKRKYRDVIRVAPYFKHGVDVHIIFLHANIDVLLQRVGARQDHYMGANMVHSQLSILEPPGNDEIDVVTIDVAPPTEEVLRETMARVQAILDQDGKATAS